MNKEFIRNLIKEGNLKNKKYFDGKDVYLVKIARSCYCCSIRPEDFKEADYLVCFNRTKSAFYIIDHSFKSKVKDIEKYKYIGEFSSQMRDSTFCNFGFASKFIGLYKYNTHLFVNDSIAEGVSTIKLW